MQRWIDVDEAEASFLQEAIGNTQNGRYPKPAIVGDEIYNHLNIVTIFSESGPGV